MKRSTTLLMIVAAMSVLSLHFTTKPVAAQPGLEIVDGGPGGNNNAAIVLTRNGNLYRREWLVEPWVWSGARSRYEIARVSQSAVNIVRPVSWCRHGGSGRLC